MLFSATEAEFAKLEILVNDSSNPVTYLAIDPGDSNGICGYSAQFKLLWVWTVRAADMIQFLRRFKHINKCIIESYHLYSHKATEQIGSSMLTPRIIGRVENWAELNDIDLIKQQASIKPVAYKFLGRKPLPKSNPNNHFMDAHAHFIYWAVRNRKIDMADLIKNDSPVELKK